MIELLTSMWVYLAGAGVIGLILGWAVRGAFVPRPKTVHVNAVAQPVATAPAALSDEQKAALERAEANAKALGEAQTRVQTLQNTVGEMRSRMEQMANAFRQQSAAQAPALSAAEIEARERAVWNERYLSSRVRHLEGLLAEAQALPSVVSAPEPQPDNTPTAETNELLSHLQSQLSTHLTRTHEAEAQLAKATSKLVEAEEMIAASDWRISYLEKLLAEGKASKPAAVETAADDAHENAVRMARLDWQNRYLRARILQVESEATVSAQAPAAPAEVVSSDARAEISSLKTEVTALKSELARETKGSGDAEQELARLRWRNRYLEGRLKYLEAASLDAEEEATSAEKVDMSSLSASSAAPQPAVSPDEPVEEVRPSSLDAPNGDADNLKLIGGIGPKIELILNELGIFHFAQIAGWTRGEVAWVDSYLRFQGRVTREKWVEQAQSLMTANAAE